MVGAMSKDSSGTVQQTAETFVAQLMRSKLAVGLLSVAPIPLFLVRSMLARDNARENRKDSWQRLRGRSEAARWRSSECGGALCPRWIRP